MNSNLQRKGSPEVELSPYIKKERKSKDDASVDAQLVFQHPQVFLAASDRNG